MNPKNERNYTNFLTSLQSLKQTEPGQKSGKIISHMLSLSQNVAAQSDTPEFEYFITLIKQKERMEMKRAF